VRLDASHLPGPLRERLLELFGPGIGEVRIVEYSWINALHGWPLAVTRRNRIYLRWGLAEFAAHPQLVLHEYFHVIEQWNTGRLTAWRYLLQNLRRGYHANPYEMEARAFAAAHRAGRGPATARQA
jgi:hypothetical protein